MHYSCVTSLLLCNTQNENCKSAKSSSFENDLATRIGHQTKFHYKLGTHFLIVAVAGIITGGSKIIHNMLCDACSLCCCC